MNEEEKFIEFYKKLNFDIANMQIWSSILPPEDDILLVKRIHTFFPGYSKGLLKNKKFKYLWYYYTKNHILLEKTFYI